jgi:hypothetical protein
MTDLLVSKTILEQLGGRKFMVMTGTKNFVGSDARLRFSLPRNKSNGNVMTITLNSMDTYDVEVLMVKSLQAVVLESHSGVYGDNLQDVFTEITGFDTHL